MKTYPVIPLQQLKFDGSILADKIKEVPKNALPVMEFFQAIEGEGLYIGQPRHLLRVGGCLVGCTGCDTPHSWGLRQVTIRSVPDLVSDISAQLPAGQGLAYTVSITGGEPMHYPDAVYSLAYNLPPRFEVALETSGLILPESMNFYEPFSFISFDVKTPSSGVPHSDDALEQLLTHYLKLCTGRFTTPTYQPGPSAQLKAVVTDDTDISWLLEKVVPFCQGNLLPLVITPANGGSLVRVVRDRVTRCLEAFSSYPCVRVIPQVHPLLGLR